MAECAAFKKFINVIPGTSSGNWNDMKIPLLAISFVFKLFIFSPIKSISPDVFLYIGLLKITFANVDFPAPFGPIITCTSPALIFRFNPFNISLSPAFACKSFIFKISVILYLYFINVSLG